MKNKRRLARGKTIEEDLTRFRSKLYFNIRKHANTIKCWTSIDGRIFAIIKTNENVEIKKIFETPQDLYALGWNEDQMDMFFESD